MLPSERWFWGWGAVLVACFVPQVGPYAAGWIFGLVFIIPSIMVSMVGGIFLKLPVWVTTSDGFEIFCYVFVPLVIVYLWRLHGARMARLALVAIMFDVGALWMAWETSAFVVCRDTNYVQDHFDSDCPFPGSWHSVLRVPIVGTPEYGKAVAERRAMRRGIDERSP